VLWCPQSRPPPVEAALRIVARAYPHSPLLSGALDLTHLCLRPTEHGANDRWACTPTTTLAGRMWCARSSANWRCSIRGVRPGSAAPKQRLCQMGGSSAHRWMGASSTWTTTRARRTGLCLPDASLPVPLPLSCSSLPLPTIDHTHTGQRAPRGNRTLGNPTYENE
jgi:hypothetical protein